MVQKSGFLREIPQKSTALKIQIIAIISRVIRDFRSAIESIVLAIGFVLIFIQGVKRYALEKKFASLHE